ncbi:hypothetical protein E4U40_005445, partial [Claviceps sp. LM458 group G5]
WTSSGLPVDFQWTSSGLARWRPFWWWSEAYFRSQMDMEQSDPPRRPEQALPASPIQIRMLEQKIVSVTPL